MNLNAVLGVAITKGAGRVTRKPIAALRRDVSELKRQVAELKRLLRAMQKDGQPRAATAAALDSEAVKPSRIRPTGPMVRKLRAKLGLMQAEFAKLAGVSGLTVYKWEKSAGRINPRGRALAGLAKVLGMGKRESKRAVSNVETCPCLPSVFLRAQVPKYFGVTPKSSLAVECVVNSVTRKLV